MHASADPTPSPTVEPLPRHRDWLLWWRVGVAALLLGGLLVALGPEEIAATAASLRPAWAFFGFALALVWLLLGALNVWVLLHRLARIRFRDFVGVYVTSWATSLLIPGQLGDATQVILLRRYGLPMSRSAAAYIVDKTISLAWLLAVGAAGVHIYLPDLPVVWLLALAVLVPGVLWVVFRYFPQHFRADTLLGRAHGLASDVFHQVSLFRAQPGAVVLNIFVTWIKWGVMAAMYLVAFRAFGEPIGLLPAATIPVVASLVGYIPITVGGAGTMEWTAVALFDSVGVPATTVLLAYLLLRLVLALCALLLMTGFPGSRSQEAGLSES